MQALILSVLEAMWGTLLDMSPYLLFGFFMAGVLSIFIRPEIVERHLGGRGMIQVAKAALFGVPLPLCSCGVIPVAASLRRHGAGQGAVTSFLISTPQTGIDSIMVTLSLLGPVFAVFRPLVSFASGLLGGGLVTLLGSRDEKERFHPSCAGECCTGCEKESRIVRALKYGFVTLPRDINRALVVGIVIAGVIAALVPDDFFAGLLGGGILSMLVMMAFGIPIYVCATASVPIAAALIAKGVSPGAALVFLMTGPATNAATVATVWKIMGRRTAMLYLLTVVVSAISAGLLLDYVVVESGVPAHAGMHRMIPEYVRIASVVGLVAVIAWSFIARSRTEEPAMVEEGKKRIRIRIDGMTCEHCARTIRRALLENTGVDDAVVDFRKGEAVVTGDGFDVSVLAAAIDELGYRFVSSEEIEQESEGR